VDREISTVEKQIVEAAEAMPEDKFNFSPESLNIPGASTRACATFAVQVKHVASSNYFIWSPLTGDKVPRHKGWEWSSGLKEQSRHQSSSEGFFCLGSQSRYYVDSGEHAADRGERQVDAPALG